MRLPIVVPFGLVAALLATAPASFAATAAKPAVSKVPKHGAVPASVPFLEDDFTKAVALAKQSKRPVFIEAWAPW